MEKKTTAKLDETKAAVKAVEAKAASKVEEAKTAVKETVEEKKDVTGTAVKAAVKDVAEETKKAVAETKEAAEKVKEAVKETVKEKRPVKEVKKPVKAVKEETKPEIIIQFDGKEAVIEEIVEKAKSQFVAEGHRASSIKSVQVYLKPEEYAAYYVINQKFAGKVDLF